MNRRCKACDAIIEKKSNQWSRQIYCSAKCRKSHNRKQKRMMSRVERRRANLLQNEETLYLVKQCRRAKTVEIFKDHTLESFIETVALVKNRPHGGVELCHVSPVRGKDTTGQFHCRNLFYAGAHQNRRNGAKYTSGGLSLNNKELRKEWAVDSFTTTNDVLLLLEKYMGEIIPRYLELVPVTKSGKVGLANKILEFDLKVDFDSLILTSYSALQKRWTEISKIRQSLPVRSQQSKFIVYVDNITRFISYGGKRAKDLIGVRDIMVIAYIALSRVKASRTINEYFYVKYAYLIRARYVHVKLRNSREWSEFKDLIYDAAFDALQGREINVRKLKNLVMSYLVFSG